VHVLVAQNMSPKDLEEVSPAQNDGWEQTVTLRPGLNRIVAYATNQFNNRGIIDQMQVTYEPAAPVAEGGRYRTLHLLAIGIGAYPNTTPLHYTTQDAEAIQAFYKQQEGKLFEHVDATLLMNAQATGKKIEEALDKMLAQAKPEDYLLLFVSSHGTGNEQSGFKFAFAPFDYDPTAPMGGAMTLLPWERILNKCKGAPCPIVLMLDTCHAGGLAFDLYRGSDPTDELVRGANGRGLYVLLACLPGETSLEDRTWQHGAFTSALLEILNGNRPMSAGAADEVRFVPQTTADFFDGTVRFRTAGAYLMDSVPHLTNRVFMQRQSPKFYSPLEASGELPLSRVR
jgi:hypothetical protein